MDAYSLTIKANISLHSVFGYLYSARHPYFVITKCHEVSSVIVLILYQQLELPVTQRR